MDLSTTVLLGLMALLALNYLLRIDTIRGLPGVLWGITMLDVTAGTLVLMYGLPGFHHVPPVRYILGLMCFMHVAENMRMVSRDRVVRQSRATEDRDERAQAMLAALRNAGDEGAERALRDDDEPR